MLGLRLVDYQSLLRVLLTYAKCVWIVGEDLACHKGLVIKMPAVSSLTPYSKGEVKFVNSKSVDGRLGREKGRPQLCLQV